MTGCFDNIISCILLRHPIDDTSAVRCDSSYRVVASGCSDSLIVLVLYVDMYLLRFR